MRRIITKNIILASIMISSIISVSASGWALERLLEINTGLEVYNMQSIPSLEAQNYSNSSVQTTYNDFLRTDTTLRNEFIRQYRWGEITHYQMQDLIKNYSNFVYYTNRTFWYIAEQERWLRGKELQNAINSGYSNIRMSYWKVRNIIK